MMVSGVSLTHKTDIIIIIIIIVTLLLIFL
jgi:hypothetical protein